MEIENDEIGPVAILRPMAKRIDAGKSENFKERYNEQLNDGCRFIALNLSLIDFVDNGGLNAIATVYKSTVALKGMMVIFGAKPPVMNQLNLSGISKVVKVFATEAEAVTFLQSLAKTVA